jgi:hypothetical protein
MTAADIRQFFQDLFGSRYIDRLELDLSELREDYNQRLRDKDEVISTLRAEKAALEGKIVIYENTILPHVSRVGADVVATRKPKAEKPSWAANDVPPMKSSWQVEVENHERNIDKLPDIGAE